MNKSISILSVFAALTLGAPLTIAGHHAEHTCDCAKTDHDCGCSACKEGGCENGKCEHDCKKECKDGKCAHHSDAKKTKKAK